MKNKLTKHDEKILASFLHKHRKNGALSLLQCKGFLFCAVCCSDPVSPSDWLPLVTNDISFKDQEKVEQFINLLMTLYNQINNQILNNTAKLPKECRILPDTMSNFVDPAPLHHWSVGFMKGYSWLSESWDELLAINKDIESILSMNIMILGAAANREAFEGTFTENMNEQERLSLVKEMLNILPEAIKTFSKVALSWRDSEPFDDHITDTMH